MAVTPIRRIRDELRVSAGVRRYQGDTFYGGAECFPLAASLGSVAIAQGDTDPAEQMRAWIVVLSRTARADANVPTPQTAHRATWHAR